ncbi:hypothetical protein V6N13_001125 [Hibiscus sabdariffa]|uniref:Uncharacterized protein n=1 Tax=Hibiscus sabdariffa TaxID=183260 RepID=A0ABR2G7L9_9ROSI
MTDIASLMAKLQFTEEDLDVKQYSLLPEGDVPEFQYGSWLKVETTRTNQDNGKKPKSGIVFTKPTEPTVVREESTLAIHKQNGDHGKGLGSGTSKPKGSNWTHWHKDGEGSYTSTKKS